MGVGIEGLGVLLQYFATEFLVGFHAQNQVVVVAHHGGCGYFAGVGRRVKVEKANEVLASLGDGL